MLHSIIQKSTYQDSITLMLLTNKINTLDGVNKVSIMMATPANKDIITASGLKNEVMEQASANDILIAMDIEDLEVVDNVLITMEEFLAQQGNNIQNDQESQHVTTWKKALELGSDTNIALISIPGMYAAIEAHKALDANKHVFIFSDNVSLEDELSLKKKAHEKGLIVMGPDCGTSIINGIPLAFTNRVRKGNIGIVGASGTGIQEISCLIDDFGGGVTTAIGTGGRDLAMAIKGITMKDAFMALHEDVDTKVIVIVSKPPAKEVREDIVAMLRASKKPVVAVFLGENPQHHEENLYFAYTLEEAAMLAVQVAQDKEVTAIKFDDTIEERKLNSKQNKIKGLYSGGTLAKEASMLIANTLGIDESESHDSGYMLNFDNHQIIDLGDDLYTQGKPHPMIDPTKRIEFIENLGDDTAVLLIDLVLGYGGNDNMAEVLAPALKEAVEEKNIIVIASICGTHSDIQDYNKQKQILEDAQVIVAPSNARAVAMALKYLNYSIKLYDKKIHEKIASNINFDKVSVELKSLLNDEMNVLNIGLKSFTKPFDDMNVKYLQFDWKPVAGGNIELQKALAFLDNYQGGM